VLKTETFLVVDISKVGLHESERPRSGGVRF
jgi:hypothetical protein